MEFVNARIIKKANIYYDGKVTSRTVYRDRRAEDIGDHVARRISVQHRRGRVNGSIGRRNGDHASRREYLQKIH